MTKHEIEEAVNRGECTLLVTQDARRAAVTLFTPDGRTAADGEADCPSADTDGLREGLRRAYRTLFNEVESRYSQKLCRAAGIRLAVHEADPAPLREGSPLLEVLPLAVDGAGGAVLTEEAARLLDPLGNLRPGVPVTLWDDTEAAPDPDRT